MNWIKRTLQNAYLKLNDEEVQSWREMKQEALREIDKMKLAGWSKREVMQLYWADLFYSGEAQYMGLYQAWIEEVFK